MHKTESWGLNIAPGPTIRNVKVVDDRKRKSTFADADSIRICGPSENSIGWLAVYGKNIATPILSIESELPEQLSPWRSPSDQTL